MSKAGRPTQPATELVTAEMNTEALASANHAATELVLAQQQGEAHVRAVALQMGYELPANAIDADLIQRDISANMRRSVEACLEVGKALTVLKAACGHGEFLARLDVLSIDQRVARRFMQSATKFSKRASTPVLAAAGNQTKLFEMLVLDDEQIDELELTGQTGELALDDVATMSVKELRAAVREAKLSAAAKDRVIADATSRINEQAEQIAKPFKPRKDSIAKNEEDASALNALTAATNSAEADFIKLAQSVDVLQQNTSEAIRARALQAVQYLVVRMRDIVLEYGLEVSVSDDALGTRPEFLDWKA